MNQAERGEDGPPETKCSRSYRLGQRAANMDETRTRILAAARALTLGDNVLSGFSMEVVAKQAGVTRVTIYNRFSSRRGLLEALFDEVGARGNLATRLPEAFALPDAREALRRYIEVFCEFWEGDRTLTRRLRAFAHLDEEFASAIASRDLRRHSIIEHLLRRMEEVAPDLLASRVQTTLALTSFEFYDGVAGQRGPQEVAPLVFVLVMRALEREP